MARRKKQVSNETRLKEPGQEKLYRVGSWSGQTQYECTLCAFDTLHEDVMIEHIRSAHTLDSLISLSEPVAARPAQTTDAGEDKSLIGVYEIDLEEVLNNATSSPD